ncbi:LETM1-like protein-domain-containing protein [Hyaloraphidium curvatum]|nr:LETM1-like protein-domain-containing protein [Hyaloraphidium curvatum]
MALALRTAARLRASLLAGGRPPGLRKAASAPACARGLAAAARTPCCPRPPPPPIAPRRLSPAASLAAFHSTPAARLAPQVPEDPDARNPSKAALVAQLLKESKAALASPAASPPLSPTNSAADLQAAEDARDALAGSQIGAPAPAAAEPAAAGGKPAKPPLWQRIKHEIQHYYHGGRLFVAETRISFRLLLKMARGSHLTRREHRQLVRTSADMFRLIPMMIFIVVPFMEFALPFALRIWPDMLPSTFESKYAEEEKRKKLLKVRLDMAKFLQDTISEMSVGGKAASSEQERQIAEFGAFFRKYRATGQLAPTEEIVRVARRFDDEAVLAHLSRPQLASMCKFVGVSTFGTDELLRYMLRKKMRDIRQDDKMIAAEGIDSLDLVELASACSARGIRTLGVSPARMRQELQQWVDLHLNHGVPSTILLLSRAFAISDQVPVVKHVPPAEALQEALRSLPDGAREETRVAYSEAVGAKVDPREKLEMLREQEKMIEEELRQAQGTAKGAVLGAAKEAVKEAKKGGEGLGVDAALKVAEAAREKAPHEAEATVARAKEAEAGAAALKQLGEALEVLASPSALAPERDDLKEIVKDRDEYREDLKAVETLVAGGGGLESKAGTMLGKRLDSLLKRIEGEMQEYDRRTSFAGARFALSADLLAAVVGDKLNLLKPDEVGLIPMEQVVLALRSIKAAPGSEVEHRIAQIIDNLDPDGDGMGGSSLGVPRSDRADASQSVFERRQGDVPEAPGARGGTPAPRAARRAGAQIPPGLGHRLLPARAGAPRAAARDGAAAARCPAGGGAGGQGQGGRGVSAAIGGETGDEGRRGDGGGGQAPLSPPRAT